MAGVKGLTPQSALLFQLIKEADNAPGTYVSTGARTVMPSLRVDLQPDTAYDKFKPMGWSARAWNLVTRLHSVLSGAVKLDFAQIPELFEMLCGPPTADDNGTPRTRTYDLIQGLDAQPRSVYTSEFGTLGQASRMPYTLLQALSLNFMRMTDSNEGSVTLLAHKPLSDNVPLTTNQGVTGTDLTTGITATGTATTPANLTDDDGATDCSFATTQTAILDFTTSKTINGAKITKGATGGHSSGVLKLQVSLTGGASFTTVQDVWSITDTSDGAWAVDASKQATFDGLAAGRYWRLLYTAASGSLAVSELELYDDAAGTINVPSLVPISPQMWTVRRADAYADLAAASPISRVKGFTMDFPDRTNLFWFLDENDIDFDDFVDGEGEVSMKLTMINDPDPASVCGDLVTKSRAAVAAAQWWRAKAQHPTLDYSLAVDGYFSCEGNIPYGNENNARHREFPFSAQLNDQDFLIRFTLVTPS